MKIFYHEIMLHISKTLKASAISCIIQTENDVKKYFIDENGKLKTGGKVTHSEAQKRTENRTMRTSWEATDTQSSMLFDDHNLKLCLRFKSPIDNHDDLYFATIHPTLGALNLKPSGQDATITTRDKEMIASICHLSCNSLIEMLNQKNKEMQELGELVVYHENTINRLKRESNIPQQKTRSLVDNKLAELSAEYNKTFVLSKDAETFIGNFAGDDISLLLDAISTSARLKAKVYQNSRITIDDTDIRIVRKENDFAESSNTNENPLDKRHEKLITYLENLENAYNIVVAKGEQATAINLAEVLRVSSAAITMWFNKHSEDAKRLCEANANLCRNSRLHFAPLKEALAGKRNKANRA